MKRLIRSRRAGGAALVLGTAGIALILLSTGALAFGQGRDRGAQAAQPPRVSDPNEVTAQNAPDAAVQGIVSVDGIDWTATTYTSPLGHCLSIEAGGGSVGGCGQGMPFLSGIGGLVVSNAFYSIVYGFAPSGTDSAHVVLVSGSTVPASQSYVGNGVWFVVYRATDGASADDPSRVELLDTAGRLIDSASPPSVSAYERAAVSDESRGEP